MKKKTLGVLMAVLMAMTVLFTGCGGGSSSGGDDVIKIGLV